MKDAAKDDAALMRRVCQGDVEAFATLYDRHSPIVYGVARRVLNNPTQAEDVTQSVFTSVWSKPASFIGGSFAAWITTVARNAAIDIMRSAAVRTREPEMPLNVPAAFNLDDEVFARARSAAVGDALRALPFEQREPIVRAYFDGLSYREVAEQLGVPLGTIKSRIRAGLKRLLETLGEAVMA